MTAQPTTIPAARRLARQGKPWRVYLTNTTSRHAFYEASGVGQGQARIRYGSINSRGQSRTVSHADAIAKLSSKLAASYDYSAATDARPAPPPRTIDGSSTISSTDALAASNLQPTPLRSLQDRLGSTTMRRCTHDDLMLKAAQDGLQPLPLQDDLRSLYPRCDAVSVLQSRRGDLLVVVRYGAELTWGAVAPG
jgi:hypothetical protein